MKRSLQKRLLATLTPARAPPNPLLPPYAHSLPPQNDPIQAPYAYSLEPNARKIEGRRRGGLKAPVRFAVAPSLAPSHGLAETSLSEGVGKSPRAGLPEAYRQWAEGMLSSTSSREELWAAWVESVRALGEALGGSHVPQIPFHELSTHLASPSTLDAIRSTGSVIVRDVVADETAVEAARTVLQAMAARDGRPVFWHKSLLGLRGDPSILSANQQLLGALWGDQNEGFILADTIQDGIPRSSPTPSLNPWGHTSTTPLAASLALTPLRLRIPSTSLAAVYASIAPLIRSKQSKISLYNPAEYLSPSNHRLIDPSELASTTLAETRMAHVESARNEVVLEPGDVIYHASGLPIGSNTPEPGLSLPISPIRGDDEGRAMAQAQKEAFEQGAPPPSAKLGGEAVQLEVPGQEGDLAGYGARRAMGY